MEHDRALMRRRKRWWWFAGVLAIVLLVTADYFMYPHLSPMQGVSRNTGRNGAWLRYTWYFGEWADADLSRIAGRLRAGQIRYAYCHVRYIKPDGQLKFRYPESGRRFTRALHREVPGVKAIAWIYVGSEKGTPTVNIGDPAIRQAMIREAVWLVNECGFDGIQWDYETCRNGDTRLISLLKETRAALPKGAILSVCTAMWFPRPVTRRFGWDDAFFARVAANCDQLAVMSYDSAQYLPRAYVWLMRKQVVHITRAAAWGNPRCQVLMGVPTYEDGGRSHHAHAENLRLALRGIREGLAERRTASQTFTGVAIFADYTTDAREWRDYRRIWLEKMAYNQQRR